VTVVHLLFGTGIADNLDTPSTAEKQVFSKSLYKKWLLDIIEASSRPNNVISTFTGYNLKWQILMVHLYNVTLTTPRLIAAYVTIS